MMRRRLVGLSLQTAGDRVIFVLLYLYYRIVSDSYYLVANMSVCGPIPNKTAQHILVGAKRRFAPSIYYYTRALYTLNPFFYFFLLIIILIIK